MPRAPAPMTLDALIVGGGVAGLWIQRALTVAGYAALTVERGRLGGGQTGAAQGIVHSGASRSPATARPPVGGARPGDAPPPASPLAAAPARWRAALAGRDPVDLRGVARRPGPLLMWPLDPAGRARLDALAATHPAVRRLPPDRRPPALGAADALFTLDEPLIDVPSLIARLARLEAPRLLRLDPLDADWTRRPPAIELTWRDPPLTVRARRLILCAGAGNPALLARLGAPPDAAPMQRRPLHMVRVGHPDLPRLDLHAFDGGPGPRLTLTTHPGPTWALGGALAERGVERSTADQITAARRLLGRLLPAVDLRGATWSARRIDRAEAATPDGRRPAGPSRIPVGPALACWPTKLALAPQLADGVLEHLRTAGVHPAGAPAAPPAALDPWRAAPDPDPERAS